MIKMRRCKFIGVMWFLRCVLRILLVYLRTMYKTVMLTMKTRAWNNVCFDT